MTEEEREQFRKELQRNGFPDAKYTRYNGQGRYGQFNLWSGPGRGLYIREAKPAIGFSGTAFGKMRPWADDKIQAFVRQDDTFQEWDYDPQTSTPDGSNAVWFNLERRTDPKGNWYESPEIRQNVIAVASKLYQKLEYEGIFGVDFDASRYAVNNAGNETEGPMKNESTIKTVKSLLEANLNVILTGAPGTGKTYTAKEVAKEMIGAKVPEKATADEKKRAKEAEEERIASVQFHPGYDYSDFVVGMKPVLVSKGKDGKGGGKVVFKNEKGELYTTDNDKKVGQPKPYTGETDVSYRWEDGIFKEFAAKARDAYDEAVEKKNAPPKFVFLIDEINRADLSRVFGELFSLLEEEYRYRVRKDDKDHEKKENGHGVLLADGSHFVIPENLYILGTMNDIDRSVESMDFALRRRFAWHEVTAESSKCIIDNKVEKEKITREDGDNLTSAMNALNEMIAPLQPKKKTGEGASDKSDTTKSVDLRLGSEYQLGGAIFAKLEKYVKDSGGRVREANAKDFSDLWSNHIENVLREYLRGRNDRGAMLDELKKAYFCALPNEKRPEQYQSSKKEIVADAVGGE